MGSTVGAKNPRRESLTSPRRLRAVEKQRQALEFRMAGLPWHVIAQRLGYANHSCAIAAVNAALDKTLRPAADEWRAITIERLTKMLSIQWPRMLQGDPQAFAACRNALKDLREILGLDAPTKTAITDAQGETVPLAILIGMAQQSVVDRQSPPQIADPSRQKGGETPT